MAKPKKLKYYTTENRAGHVVVIQATSKKVAREIAQAKKLSLKKLRISSCFIDLGDYFGAER